MTKPKARFVVCAVGALALLAGQAAAGTIWVQKFTEPERPDTVVTVTLDLMEDGQRITQTLPLLSGGFITRTIGPVGTMIISETSSLMWQPSVVITPTIPVGEPGYLESSWFTDTVPDPTGGPDRRIAVVNLDWDGDQDITVAFTNTQIPEPTTAALWAAGLGIAWFTRRRLRKQ